MKILLFQNIIYLPGGLMRLSLPGGLVHPSVPQGGMKILKLANNIKENSVDISENDAIFNIYSNKDNMIVIIE